METQTKKCPKCFTDIPLKAIKCPNCQSDIRPKKRLAWSVSILCILIFIMLTSAAITHEPTPAKPADPVEWAGTYATVYVTKTLKSPSTAKFPVIRANNVTDLGNGKYRVSSYVDSQNGFGATIRSNWEVTLVYKGGNADLSQSWKTEKIVVDGKVVYKQ